MSTRVIGRPVGLASRTGVWVVVALLAAALSGCSDPIGPRAEALQEARSLWESGGHDDYAFRYELFCFCPVEGPVDIWIEADSVAAATVVRTGEPVPVGQLSMYPTIDELFDRLEESLGQDPVQFDIEYDAEVGYPSSGSIDISVQIADEEYSFTVENFNPGD